jgi:opacity protein-like surface antigen
LSTISENAVKNTLRYLSFAVVPSVILAVTPSYAQDQRDALLEAALKRISALEAKVGKIDTLEQENRQLRSKLGKTQPRREAYAPVSTASNQLVAIGRSADEIEPMPRTNRWQGFYAGINAGYGTGNLNNYTSTATFDKATGTLQDVEATRELGYIGGGLAGGQFGYNHVFANHIVLGAEADINWADIYNNTSPTSLSTNAISLTPGASKFGLAPLVDSNTTSEYRRVGMDWVGTVRARVGYDLGKFLPYITGGLAYGGLSSHLANYDYGMTSQYTFGPIIPSPGPIGVVAEPVGSTTTGYNPTVNFGWVLGAGAEYMVADGWSVKGEYLYTSIGGNSMPHYTTSIEASDTKTYTREHTGSFGVHQARVGLNYHPGWSFGETLISAKY